VRGIVGVMHDRRTRLSGQVLDALRARYGDQMLKATVRKAVRMAEAPGAHRPITSYDPDGMAAKDVRDLAEELAA
jgi:cellulose biosynthesis protein BcsQ